MQEAAIARAKVVYRGNFDAQRARQGMIRVQTKLKLEMVLEQEKMQAEEEKEMSHVTRTRQSLFGGHASELASPGAVAEARRMLQREESGSTSTSRKSTLGKR